MNYLLDTNHLSPLVTMGHPLRKRVQTAASNGHAFTIIPLVVNEFIFGIGTLPRANQNLEEWARIRSEFAYYTVDASDGMLAAKLRVTLRKKGWQLELVDSFIAVIALQNNLTLLTTDNDFSTIPNLETQNWLA